MTLTTSQLFHIAPQAKPASIETFLPWLNKYMPKYEITTAPRITAFLANVVVESGSFNYVKELGNDAYFQKYEPGTSIGKALGNTQVGDGARFKGRGILQLSGRALYSQCSAALFSNDVLLLNPAQLEQPYAAVASACWFWRDVKQLNIISDKPEDWTRLSKNGITYSKFDWICRIVNGGSNGKTERQAAYKRAQEVIV